jgi:hypothetical protein
MLVEKGTLAMIGLTPSLIFFFVFFVSLCEQYPDLG